MNKPTRVSMTALAASPLERLSLTPRPGGAAPRLPFGLRGIDDRLGGGLERAGLHEIRAPVARDMGAALGLAFALLAGARAGSGRERVLWITDPAAAADLGAVLFPDGIAQWGLDPGALTLVQPMDLKGALWAADEGAKCTDLAAVVLQVKGNPRPLDRVATRRLLIRARESGVFTCLLRQSGAEEASAALTRWRAEPRPSRRDRAFPAGLGLPRMEIELERSRTGEAGRWTLEWNPRTRSFHHAPDERHTAPLSGHRPAAPVHRSPGAGAMGQVLALGRPPGGGAARGPDRS